MTRFNETVGSYETSVLTAARRFDDLGIAESPVPAPEPVEATIRPAPQPTTTRAERHDRLSRPTARWCPPRDGAMCLACHVVPGADRRRRTSRGGLLVGEPPPGSKARTSATT